MAGALAVLCGLGALLVRVGMGFHQAGLLRAKNSAGAVLRQVADIAAAILAFWAVGAALAFAPGQTSFIGLRPGLLFRLSNVWAAGQIVVGAPDLLIVLSFVLIAGGIVSGAVAERSKFFPMLAVSAAVGGLIIPICAYWVWNDTGWLARLGYRDWAGASVIHVAGGVVAAIGAIFIGARNGKYNRDGSSNAIPGHSMPLASLGVMLMLVAWVPYVALRGNPDYAAALALNVLVAGAAGGLASIILSQVRYGKPDIHLAYAGVVAALVAITAGGGMGTRHALVVGVVAGVFAPILLITLDLVWRLDDGTGAVAIHLGGGIWGTLAAGLLGAAPSWGARLKATGVQTLGLIAIIALAGVLSAGLFLILKRTVGLRSKEADEFDGLDLAEHDINAYPDFQQTMIKSYHLREA